MAKLDLGKVVPIKGEDYFTNSEIEEIKSDIEQEIEVPTKTSDLTNDSGFINKDVNNLTNYTLGVETGSSIDLSLDSSTYVMTLSLKNSNGTVLNTKTVDLPLESVVVNGVYDSTNKKIILTLESGSTIDVPVGDLINGLQSEITSNNKLSSDLVDDTNNTNKFVTSSEKQAWNNKSDFSGDYEDLSNKPTIPDELADLQSDSTHRTVTDAEKTTWNGKQDTLTFDSTPTENSTNPVTSDGIFQALAGAGGGSDANVQYLGDVSKYNGSNNNVLDITGMKKGIYIINNDNNSAQYGSSIYMKSNYNGSDKTFSFSYSQSRIKPYIFLELINDVPTTVTSNKVIGYVYEYQTYWGWWKGTITFKSSGVTIAGEFAGVQALYTDINRTVTGKLTFNTLPETSVTPTTDTQLVNKSYVDAQIQALREELSGE